MKSLEWSRWLEIKAGRKIGAPSQNSKSAHVKKTDFIHCTVGANEDDFQSEEFHGQV